MKKLILALATAFSFTIVAQTVDTNFDGTWPTNTSYPANDPDGWISTNVLTNSFASASNPTSVTQSTVNCSGGFSMRIETKKFTLGALNGFVPDTCGFAFTGTVAIQFSGARLVDGFPYDQRPTQITYCYQSEPQPGDTCGISVLMWKWNGSSRTYIGGAKDLYPNVTTSMQNATLTIAYTSTLTPDSMAIYTASSYKYPTIGTGIRMGAKEGSVFYVDNIMYPASTVGIKEKSIEEYALKVYPNPAQNTLMIAAENNEATSIRIVDITGKMIEEDSFNASGEVKLDVSKYYPGFYFYAVTNKNNQVLKTGKFTVTH